MKSQRKKFEYDVLHIDLCANNFDEETYLNSMGKNGWELIGVTCKTHGKPILYFKRELIVEKK